MISSSRRKFASGFTLIELLVVVGIIVLLAAILVPAVGHAYKVAQRTRMASDLQVISQALTAYKNDFGDYPRIQPPTGAMNAQPTGAVLLCWALVAPGPMGDGTGANGSDGADGPGFRVRGTTGKVWGPYLPADRFQIVIATNGSGAGGSAYVTQPAVTFNDWADMLADSYGNPIFYYPANKAASPSVSYVGTTPQAVFNYYDNGSPGSPPLLHLPCTIAKWTLQQMQMMMGNAHHTGRIESGETPVATGPYLLWAAGPDQFFGTDDDVVDNGQSLQLSTATAP